MTNPENIVAEEQTQKTSDVPEWIPTRRPVAELLAWTKNPRTITVEAIERLKERILLRGMHDVLKLDFDNRTVLSGNQRLKVVREMGFEEVNCLVPSRELTEEEKDKVALESNIMDGTWWLEGLKEFDTATLEDVGLEINLDLIVEDGALDDEQPEPRKTDIQKGDMFKLGEHILLCGDATSTEDVERLMAGAKADMIFTDPPYNVDYQGTKFNKIKGDDQTEEQFIKFADDFIARMSEATKPGGVFYICSGYSSFPTFLWALRKNGLEFSTPIVWVKNNTSLGWGNYRHKHEMVVKAKNPKGKKAQPILYGWKAGEHFFFETRFEADVWEIKRRASGTMMHPTQKPLELIRRARENSSQRHETILDLFCGGGSTLIACEKLLRVCRAMDLDPVYCQVTIDRWEKFTGLNATKI